MNQSVELTPQTTPIPMNTSAPSHTPNAEQQPEVDEDGYCIQPKDPLWNAQWPKKGTNFETEYEPKELVFLRGKKIIKWFFCLCRFRFGQ